MNDAKFNRANSAEKNLNWVVRALPEDCRSIIICADGEMFDERKKHGMIPLHDDRKDESGRAIPCFVGYVPTSNLSDLDKLAALPTNRHDEVQASGTCDGGCTQNPTIEVFEHFGLSLEDFKRERREFDFIIYKASGADVVTGNMAGFGLEQSQRIIIDYDKNYDQFLVRREDADYEGVKENER